ncbi:MAG TPA: hypothetical protein VJK30_03095 [Coxiellaceae bacterium]|nr:MAG: hypothetical protein A3E81_03095 [Gammaproteobacteria bacterium RIFCSPHIGHO2_12_FULL_36_30]HLB56301.1 hypothetical protein [Coxiellaceae bacterium]
MSKTANVDCKNPLEKMHILLRIYLWICLISCFITAIGLIVGAIICLLLAMSSHSPFALNFLQLFYPMFISLIFMCIGFTICLRALLKWKKWGFWGFAIITFITIGTNYWAGIKLHIELTHLIPLLIIFLALKAGKNNVWNRLR